LKVSKEIYLIFTVFSHIIKYGCCITQEKISMKENFNLPMFKKIVFYLQQNKKFGFFKRKGLGMKNKTFTYECNCIHCQQKLNQINNSKIYWDKLISRKKLV